MNPRITPGWGWFLPPFPGKIGDTYGLIVGENNIDVSKAIVNHLPILPQMVGIRYQHMSGLLLLCEHY